MKERCYNPRHTAYPLYGGRGIAVCERWLDFQKFVEDNEASALPGLTLDRINNDGPYSPENCRWATRKDQARNRRNNQWIEHAGERLLAVDWAARLSLADSTIEARVKNGWSLEKAVTTPFIPPSERWKWRST
jgi:hypothetical protein